MAWDTYTETVSLEKYLQEYHINRDEAQVKCFFAKGTLASGKNRAGMVYHNPKSNCCVTLHFDEIAALGVDPKELMALDAQAESISETIFQALVAAGKDPFSE